MFRLPVVLPVLPLVQLPFCGTHGPISHKNPVDVQALQFLGGLQFAWCAVHKSIKSKTKDKTWLFWHQQLGQCHMD